MKQLLALLSLVVVSAFGCNITHWSARKQLEREGYSDIYFGESPGEPNVHPFTAERAGRQCSGIVTIEEQDGNTVAQVDSSCDA